MEIGEVRDLYQASYYLLSGCELVEVECYEEGRVLPRGKHQGLRE